MEVNISRTARAAAPRSLAPSGVAPITVDLFSGTEIWDAGLSLLFGFRALQLLDDSFDLQNVVRVVPGKHSHHMGDAFLAALQMHAVVLPGFVGNFLQHDEIIFAQHAKDFERAFRGAAAVFEYRRPRILIKGLNGDAVFSDDRAHAPT